MKKALYTCCILAMMFVFSGCTKVIDLTDEENYMIAEYAAELLIKYDKNLDLKYNSTTEAATTEEDTTEATTEEITEEPTTEAVTTEAPVDVPASTEADGTTEQQGSAGNVGGLSDVSGVVADMEASEFDLAEFADVDNVAIRYAYYMVAERYPSHDKDGMFIEIEAPSGYKLLVVKFDIENQTNDDQYIDLYSKDITYNIILNDSKSAKQMLTILIDDLYTYQYTVAGSMREEAVLLFQVSDAVASRIQDAKLKVTYDNKSCVLQLH